MQLVRSVRGSVAHHPSCKHVRRCRTVPAGAGDALCLVCAPQCVVCQSAQGRPTGCPYEHGLCDACANDHAVRHAAWRPDAPLRCPCNEGPDLDVRALPDDAFEAWRRGVTRSPPPPPVFSSVTETLCSDARTRRCPHCHRIFADYDGCASVQCHCGGFFCALCLRGFRTSEGAHAHVGRCPLNPTRGDYFVPAECVEDVWSARARTKMEDLFARVRDRDGTLLAWCARRAVRRFDPTLVPVDWTWRGMSVAMLVGGLIGMFVVCER